jgi:hypothetical protein
MISFSRTNSLERGAGGVRARAHACVALSRCVAFGRPKMSVWGHAGAGSPSSKVACISFLIALCLLLAWSRPAAGLVVCVYPVPFSRSGQYRGGGPACPPCRRRRARRSDWRRVGWFRERMCARLRDRRSCVPSDASVRVRSSCAVVASFSPGLAGHAPPLLR